MKCAASSGRFGAHALLTELAEKSFVPALSIARHCGVGVIEAQATEAAAPRTDHSSTESSSATCEGRRASDLPLFLFAVSRAVCLVVLALVSLVFVLCVVFSDFVRVCV